MNKKLINLFKKIILGEQKSWALFENGTCIILMNPENNLSQQAKNILSEFGPVHAGTPSGDFEVIELEDEDGWVVGCHHPDILTYVSPDEIENPPEEVKIGLFGRSKRNIDANELKIIHIEDKKSKNIILFNKIKDPYGEFSNFAPFPIDLDDQKWPTTEHYFQAQKFSDFPEYQEKIRLSKSPMIAAMLGRSRKIKIRKDWETIKDNLMYKTVKTKFLQHENLKKLLINTGNSMIVEDTKRDAYWGNGRDGNGKNMLGKILMKVRDELK